MINHICMNIDGAIRNAKDLKGCVTVEGCTLNTVAEIREWLNSQKAKGRRVLRRTRSDLQNSKRYL